MQSQKQFKTRINMGLYVLNEQHEAQEYMFKKDHSSSRDSCSDKIEIALGMTWNSKTRVLLHFKQTGRDGEDVEGRKTGTPSK